MFRSNTPFKRTKSNGRGRRTVAICWTTNRAKLNWVWKYWDCRSVVPLTRYVGFGNIIIILIDIVARAAICDTGSVFNIIIYYYIIIESATPYTNTCIHYTGWFYFTMLTYLVGHKIVWTFSSMSELPIKAIIFITFFSLSRTLRMSCGESNFFLLMGTPFYHRGI